MSRDLFANLAWLPRAPEDFASRCRNLVRLDGDLGGEIRALSSHGLDEGQLNRLARSIAQARVGGRSLAPLKAFRLGLVGNATTHFLVPALIATAARHGIALDCVEAEFGQVSQSILSPNSELFREPVDAVLLALDHRGLPFRFAPGDATATATAALDYVASLRDAVARNGNAVSIVQTVPRPVEPAFGSLDLALPGTSRSVIDEFNRGLAAAVAGSGDVLLDVAALAENIGLSEWHDPTLWNVAKVPFSMTFVPIYADHVCRVIASLRGLSRRCLVLDLDNTLWSGVIGDDGLEGILIGQGDATGEAHLEVQRTALMLRERGIVLAVSSKNNDDVARGPFRQHPEMALKENHFAVFQANWNDKATNIKAIAEELSLGLASFVFLDDNPAERALVRQVLPDVAVPELPADPALYARTLLVSGYFEALAFSQEDRQRADFYQDNARRVGLQKQAGDIDAYLASLDMTITFQPFDDIGRARITQLINKSNQFNLTTRRYTEADVRAAAMDPDCFHLQIRLADTFGDNGMISVVICRRNGTDWEIDTWLMSCRVLGRRVEQAVLNELLVNAKRRGLRRIIGRYIPTERNGMVADHYGRLGFNLLERDEDGTSIWSLSVADTATKDVPMRVERGSLEPADDGSA